MKLFVASTGRCGTTFMYKVLNALTDLTVFHEPRPKFKTSRLCARINNDIGATDEEFEAACLEKITQIERDTDESGNYVETSHYFIKSYVDLILDNFDDVYCIYLHRNPIEVLGSWTLMVAKQLHTSLEPHLEPHYKKNLLRIPDGGLDVYSTILWNWFEVHARFLHYKDRFVKTFDFDFKNINDTDTWKKMLDHFEIELKPEYANMTSLPDVFKYTSRTPLKLELGGLKNSSFEEVMKFVMKRWH